VEKALGGKLSLADELRLHTVQMTAMISLLREGWFEPPAAKGAHFSTLVQQVLSFIAQNGGATIGELYALLCTSRAPFAGVSKADFAQLTRHLGQKELLMQDSSGLLLHGPVGEKFVNHYTFYAAFAADEEFRIITGSKTLGTLPISQALTVGQRILFAGRTWRVEEIDEEQKTILVAQAGGGTPPLFSGGVGRTHSRVRQAMRRLLESAETPIYLDATAARFLGEGRATYARRNLGETYLVDQGREFFVFTWLGDAANEALAWLLRLQGMAATAGGPGVEILKGQLQEHDVSIALQNIGTEDLPPVDELLADVQNLRREKWDWALSEALLRTSYASLCLLLDEAQTWANSLPAH
jgi:ATP-dependent Lhr-like helicase